MLRLRPTLAAARHVGTSLPQAPALFRSIHSRVPLPYPIQDGLNPFLSPAALKTVAVDWQEGVLARLNEVVQGTDYSALSVLETVKQTATDPTQALAFNYASEALNNSFFLSTLSPEPSAPNPSSAFSRGIASGNSPLEGFPSLISYFSAHVWGLHPSSGAYVWIATDRAGNIGVLGTYAGGTLLVHQRRQTRDTLYAGDRVLGESLPTPKTNAEAAGEKGSTEEAPVTPAGPLYTTVARPPRSKGSKSSFSPSVAGLLPSVGSVSNEAAVGKEVFPLACISLHPHCYLADYGVWGREEYVRRWWGAVDWAKVEENYSKFTGKK